MKHELKRIYRGKGTEMDSITPICSCGWQGTRQYAYNDCQHSLLKDDESKHLREVKEAGK